MINVRDFWQRVPGDPRYCLVCFAVPDARTRVIPHALRAVFRHPGFRTKAHRTGKVMRVTHDAVSYYTSLASQVTTIALEGC